MPASPAGYGIAPGYPLDIRRVGGETLRPSVFEKGKGALQDGGPPSSAAFFSQSRGGRFLLCGPCRRIGGCGDRRMEQKGEREVATERISLEEAVRRLVEALRPSGNWEEIPLEAALGRVTAWDLEARSISPPLTARRSTAMRCAMRTPAARLPNIRCGCGSPAAAMREIRLPRCSGRGRRFG